MSNNIKTDSLDIKAILNMRAQIYFLLSRLYEKEVDKELFYTLRNHLPLLEELSKSSEDEAFIKGVGSLKNRLLNINNENLDEFIDELARIYAMLFLNVTASIVEVKTINPYESVYLSEEGLMYQQETEDVLKFYINNKVITKKSFNEPDDHIAAELAFIGHLNEQAIRFLDENNYKEASDKIKTSKEFMEKHLLRWVNKLCLDIRETDISNFYKPVADITLGFIRTDYKSLEDLVNVLNQDV
ncbi:MAG: molecular chaperone TorD family protein [Deferribacterota bacterium]|nr:molecular chaperone TorD family protein [Deferribacterota bacterium]